MPANSPILACFWVSCFLTARALAMVPAPETQDDAAEASSPDTAASETVPSDVSDEPSSTAEANSKALPPEPIALSHESVLKFATVEEGRELLGRHDIYVRSLGPLEMQIRLRSAEPVDIETFIQHVQEQVLPWEEEELARMVPVAKSLAEKLSEYEIPLPESMYLIRTTGKDESDAAYTRGAAIVLPRRRRPLKPQSLERLLAHELFHVLSRHNPELRQRLYAIIGFQPCNSIELPESIAPRRITNPDAPTIDYYVTIQRAVDEQTVDEPSGDESTMDKDDVPTESGETGVNSTDSSEADSPEADDAPEQPPETEPDDSQASEVAGDVVEENEEPTEKSEDGETPRREMVNVVPILLCDRGEYDPKRQRLFDYLQFRLMAVYRASGTWRPLLMDGQPQLIDGRHSESYRERIGENTNYIIHPDEILADNFVHLVMRTSDLKSPEIVEQMRSILQSSLELDARDE